MASRVPLTRTTAAERRWLVGLAVAALIPFVLLALWAHASAAPTVEQQIVDALALGHNLAGDLLVTLNTIGNVQNWIIVVVVSAVVIALVRGVRAGLLVGATYLVDFVASGAKYFAERGRPDTPEAHLLFGVDSYGFPSGHAARAAALVGAVLWVFLPVRWRLPVAALGAIVGGLAMGYARVALGVHFPTDVIGGMLLGVAWFGISAALI